MASERSPKRQKTSDGTETSTPLPPPADIPLPPDKSPLDTSGASPPQPQRSSWYVSWSRKAPAIAQVARESIRSTSNTTSEAASSAPGSLKTRAVRTPSLAMTLGKKQSSRALPVDATTTVVHATSDVRTLKRSPTMPETADTEDKTLSMKTDQTPVVVFGNQNVSTGNNKAPSPDDRGKEAVQDTSVENVQGQRSSWLGWLGKADTAQPPESSLKEPPKPVEGDSDKSTQPTPLEQSKLTDSKLEPSSTTTLEEPAMDPSQRKPLVSTWRVWAGDNVSKQSLAQEPAIDQTQSRGESSTPPPTKKENTHQAKPNTVAVPTSPPPELPQDGTKPSGWAFWSRDRNVTDSSTSISKPHEGEIAIADTPSQTKPKRASISLNDKDKKPDITKLESKTADSVKDDPKKPESTKSAHKPGETYGQLAKDTMVKQHKKGDTLTSKAESSNATATAQSPKESTKPASVRSSKISQNLLLPELYSTLKLPETPSMVQQVARLLGLAKEPEQRHLSLIKDPPRIKNALAIGVHGFFPAPLLRTVLGQPTGTSIKFADMAAKSIKRWTAAHGYECQVKTAALEGEGKIAERIELLWKLLLNWIDEIRKSDFVLVACHSQGVPVAIMLVAKLIEFGCVSSAKVGICAMAGVNMGPFAEYKSRWISGSAGELFEFSLPSSRVSKDYLAALEVVLKFGVRVTFIGSIDDQLVSLESSIFSPITHPHIYRAVQIDSKVHAPNFLSHLVGFSLKLRNLGVQDHGLIRELSPPLAGSLYTGEGHSRIYEDDAVYDLAVSFALETNSMNGVQVSQRSGSISDLSGAANPYILPFAMRGMLEEDFVKNELQNEASELLQQFDEWKPTTKVLKDVKFRLEGIRSKL